MIKIGLTGNIAAGKSEVEKIFKKLGFPTISADDIVHNLFENNIEVKNKVVKAFGEFDILSNGKLDRKKLGKIVFSDMTKKKEIENIIHPVVVKEIFSFFDKNKDEKLVLVDIPLLFEGHFEYLVDKIILVYANDKIRFERIKKRNNLEDEYIEKIMKSQLNQDLKKEKSDIVIINENKSLEELEKEIKEIVKNI